MKPKFKILCDHTDITDKINGRLVSLSITDEFGIVSDTATLELDNRDNALAIPSRGAMIEIYIGYDLLYPMGQFVADEIEIKSPPNTMSITARASDSVLRDMGAYLAPRSQSWEKKSLQSIINMIAARYGLTATIAPEFAGIMITHEDQADESDCAFVQRLAENNGAVIKVANGKMLVIEPLTGHFPDGTPIPPISIDCADVGEYCMRLADRGKYGKVVAKYYDFDKAKEQETTAGSKSPAFTLRETFISRATAHARAKAKLAAIKRGTKTLSLKMVGNPLLSAESKIVLTGMPDELAGDWIVKSAKHDLSSSGYTTQIDAIQQGGTDDKTEL